VCPAGARKRDVFAFRPTSCFVSAAGHRHERRVFRPEAQRGRFLYGSPPRGDDPDDAPLEQVDHALFEVI
jgi:hypothetical protein